MICYPLDNTEYEANALGAWCGTRTRGVFAAEEHYAVTSNDNMTVTVSSGLAWLKADQFWGVAAFEPNAQVLAISTADGSLSRIDTVCVRLDKNQNRAEIIIKKGAYSPQPPVIVPPVRNLDFDEIYVATIMVRAGATSILPTDITDLRLNETYCGIMRDGVTGIPTAQLQAQVQELIDQLSDEIASIEQGSAVMLKAIYEGSAAGVVKAADYLTTPQTATDTPIVDADGHFPVHNVESALQFLGKNSIRKVVGSIGNFVIFGAEGEVQDSGKGFSDFAPAMQVSIRPVTFASIPANGHVSAVVVANAPSGYTVISAICVAGSAPDNIICACNWYSNFLYVSAQSYWGAALTNVTAQIRLTYVKI